jgi:uncharacterized protein YlxP (DUF503 family)
MRAGYVGILSIDLHLPESHSLKGKRHDVRSLKADLQHRFGSAVAEVDGHELWQRSMITAALVDRRASDLERRLDEVERFVVAHHETARIAHYAVVTPEDLT